MSKSSSDYYVYVYSNPDTRQPFYVGKGHGRRALAHMDFEEAGFDLVAGYPSETLRNHYVGRALDAHFGFGRFTYEKIRRPKGRF